MKGLVAIYMLGLVSVIMSSPAATAEEGTGAARLHAIDHSGVQARIVFLDTGNPQNGLVVSGIASGLDPTQMYFTLVYDTGSKPGGPAACVPTGNPPLTGAQMAVGFWTVADDGTGNSLCHQERRLLRSPRRSRRDVRSDRARTTTGGIRPRGLRPGSRSEPVRRRVHEGPQPGPHLKLLGARSGNGALPMG